MTENICTYAYQSYKNKILYKPHKKYTTKMSLLWEPWHGLCPSMSCVALVLELKRISSSTPFRFIWIFNALYCHEQKKDAETFNMSFIKANWNQCIYLVTCSYLSSWGFLIWWISSKCCSIANIASSHYFPTNHGEGWSYKWRQNFDTILVYLWFWNNNNQCNIIVRKNM